MKKKIPATLEEALSVVSKLEKKLKKEQTQKASWINAWEEMYNEVGRLKAEVKFWADRALKEANEKNERMEKWINQYKEKLADHGLVPGRVMSKCDSCRNNGNCNIQNIFKVNDRRKAGDACFFGPIPIDEHSPKYDTFTFELVDQSNNEDLQN